MEMAIVLYKLIRDDDFDFMLIMFSLSTLHLDLAVVIKKSPSSINIV